MDDVKIKEFLLWCKEQGIQQVSLTPEGGVTAVFSALAMVPETDADRQQGSARAAAVNELLESVRREERVREAAREFEDPDSPLDEDPDLYYSSGT